MIHRPRDPLGYPRGRLARVGFTRMRLISTSAILRTPRQTNAIDLTHGLRSFRRATMMWRSAECLALDRPVFRYYLSF
jgi:hypothetical protein